MLKGFKEFILRGNVIDLAVAVVIGAAFTAIVTALVNGIFNPVIGLLFDSGDLSQAVWTIRGTPGADDAVEIGYGSVIAAIIQFLLVALVVYFALIVPMNYLKKNAFWKKQDGEAPVAADTPPTELELLTDIRDLLAKGRANDGTELDTATGRHAAIVDGGVSTDPTESRPN